MTPKVGVYKRAQPDATQEGKASRRKTVGEAMTNINYFVGHL